MSWNYPVFLDLTGRPCLVAGNGFATEAKIRGLLDAGAEVTLIAPSASSEVAALAEQGRIRWLRREFEPGDMPGYFLAISTGDDRSRNRALWEEARRANVLFNAVDDPPHCDFSFGAVVSRGDLIIATGTNGKCPALGVRLKERFESEVGPEYAEFAGMLGRLRPEIARRIPDFARRRELWYRLVDSEALEYVRRGETTRAEALLKGMVTMETWQGMEGEELLREALAANEARACLTCSFQAEDVVVLDMVRRIQPGIPVLFLDTGYHFPETLEYRDRLARQWGFPLVNVTPASTVAEQAAGLGRLYESDPGRCCGMRKVEPLMRALEEYDIWITGLRREQSPTRAGLKTAERHVLPSGKAIWKLNPLAGWKMNEVWSYLAVHEIDPLPLYERGYTSIGCAPCTSLPKEGEGARSGRWGGQKLECGIHTVTAKEP